MSTGIKAAILVFAYAGWAGALLAGVLIIARLVS